MNTFGDKIKITIFGQSHAEAIGVTIDGLAAGFEIDKEKVQSFLDRRAPGKNAYSTARNETDTVVQPFKFMSLLWLFYLLQLAILYG